MRRGGGNALLQLLSPAVWNAGHRVARDVLHLMRAVAATPFLVGVVRGALPDQNRLGAEWHDSLAALAANRFSIPASLEQARVDMSQSPLGLVFALLHDTALDADNTETVAQAVRFINNVLSVDLSSWMVPGWETLGLAVRAGLLRALAALAPAAGWKVQKEVGLLLGRLVRTMCVWVPSEGNKKILNAFQKEWLGQFIVEPLQVLLRIKYVLEMAKTSWSQDYITDEEFIEQLDKAFDDYE